MTEHAHLSVMFARYVGWVARITGSLLLAFLLFMLIGNLVGDANGPDAMRFNNTREFLAFLSFPVGTIIGLMLAYKWAIAGGTIATTSLVILFLLLPNTLIPRFVMMVIPGILYMLGGWLTLRAAA